MASSTESSECIEVLTENLRKIDELSETIGTNQVSFSSIGNSWHHPSDELKTALTVLHAAAGSIYGAATKFGLLCKASPKKAEIQSLCDEMTSFCDNLSSALRVAMLSGAADPLSNTLHSKVKSILHAVSDLVSMALSGARNEKGEVELAPAAGVVWSACDDIQKPPNQIGMLIGGLLFHQLVENSKQSPRDPADGDRNSEEENRLREMSNDDFFMEMGDVDDDLYTLEECRCAEAIVDLMRMSRRSLKFAMDVTKDMTERTEDQLAWVHQLYLNAKGVIELVTNLGMSLYPPLGKEELDESKTIYMDCLQSMINQLVNADFVNETQQNEILVLQEKFVARLEQANAALLTI
eukprot:CAMPEP_0117788428 /NCGR_PEP_ID=MMETSP0948-20121206/7011_1 /TAXON_ID=44440 /ORGANISM="Chattonella subsalsa, Strain CCMP2191" /LENGTH=351 /DNA_ID=CAMNT_0005617799 /DNA_START=47 /DNA_END=1104 /DNA_ORIENTATION=+